MLTFILNMFLLFHLLFASKKIRVPNKFSNPLASTKYALGDQNWRKIITDISFHVL